MIFGQVPSLRDRFIQALLIGGTLNIVALIQFVRAIQASDLSLTIPFVTFTPVFLLVTTLFLLGEVPPFSAVVRIGLIVFGSFILQLQELHQGLWGPVRALLREEGPRRMLSVALLYSITANFDKIGVRESSPFFGGLAHSQFLCSASCGLCSGVCHFFARLLEMWTSGFLY